MSAEKNCGVRSDVCLHTPVLLSEVLSALAPRAGGRYLDGTLGLAGHAEAVLQAAHCELLGLDRDPEALAHAQRRLAPFAGRVFFMHKSYSAFSEALQELGWARLDGALLDIGVSSMQLDCRERGFSFRKDGPLDMRMDQSAGVQSAFDLVNKADPEVLRDGLTRFGEEPNAARIVKALVARRAKGAIISTLELANLVFESYPKAWRAKARHHPATRTFQALRMMVNDELGELTRFLSQILPYLAPKGRLVIITFHSLEDRLVKQCMQRWAKGCICPPYVDRCVCGHTPQVVFVHKKPVQASPEEIARNPRASSAKLRAVEKVLE